MAADLERRRALLLAGVLEGAVLRQVLTPILNDQNWELFPAETVERARFVLRFFRCDVLLVDEGLYRREGPEGLAWLAAQRAMSVILFADWDANLVEAALERGVHQWLPRGQVLHQPRVLIPFLERAAGFGDLRHELHQLGEAHAARQRQVSELLEQLGELLPLGQRNWWLPAPQLIGRLEEEVERARRYGAPLAVALGEFRTRLDSPHSAAPAPPVGRWVARQVDKVKRLTDVGGPCGPRKFLLLLPHTLRAGAVTFCRRIKAALEEPAVVPGELLPALRASFGVVGCPAGARDAPQLLKKAERCLARARRGESDGVVAE